MARIASLWVFLAFLLALGAWGRMAPVDAAVGTGMKGVALPPAQPTPSPSLDYEVVGAEDAGEWLVYATGSGISAIVPAEDAIWAASRGGLLRWDRATGDLAQYLAPQMPLPGNDLTDLLEVEGQLIIAGAGGLVAFDGQDTWTPLTGNTNGFEIEPPYALATVDGALWVGGKGGLARQLLDGTWTTEWLKEEYFPHQVVSRIVPRADGLYIGVTPEFGLPDEVAVLRRVRNQWREARAPVPQDVVYLVGPDNTLWRSDGRRLHRSVDNGASWEPVPVGPFRYVQPRAFDAAGRLYVSDNSTIWVLGGDETVERYAFEEVGPELDVLNLLAFDEADRLWIATDGNGMSMYDGAQWHNWRSATSNLREDCIRGLTVSEGQVFAGINSSAEGGGLSIHDIATGQWVNYWPGETELSGGGVRGLAADAEGRVYLPTAKGIVDIYDHGAWSHVALPLPPDAQGLDPTEGAVDEAGVFWLAANSTGGNLWRYDGSTWISYSVAGWVAHLAVGPGGYVWMSTSHGLAVLDPEGTVHHYPGYTYPVRGGGDVAVDAEGRVWTAGPEPGSITIFNGQDWRTLTPREGGYGNAIVFDSKGHPWFGKDGAVATYRGTVDLAPFAGLVDLPPEGEPMPLRRMPVVSPIRLFRWALPQFVLFVLLPLGLTAGVGALLLGGFAVLIWRRDRSKRK